MCILNLLNTLQFYQDYKIFLTCQYDLLVIR